MTGPVDDSISRFDLTRLAINFEPSPPTRPGVRKRSAGSGARRGEFLGGLPPLAHLAAAGRVPGRALHVAVVLWFIAGVENRRERIALRPSVLDEFGVDRHAAYRALRALEDAGLVTVCRAKGRAPIVDLLDAPAPVPSSQARDDDRATPGGARG